MSGSIYYVVRWFVEEERHSLHAGVSAAISFWLLTNFLVFETTQFVWRVSELALESMSSLSHIVAELVNELYSTGHISESAKQKIDSIVSEARDALKKQKK